MTTTAAGRTRLAPDPEVERFVISWLLRQLVVRPDLADVPAKYLSMVARAVLEETGAVTPLTPVGRRSLAGEYATPLASRVPTGPNTVAVPFDYAGGGAA